MLVGTAHNWIKLLLKMPYVISMGLEPRVEFSNFLYFLLLRNCFKNYPRGPDLGMDMILELHFLKGG